MKSILKLIKRFIVTMLFTLVLLFFLNLFLFLLVSYRQAANHGAWSSADTVASALTRTEMERISSPHRERMFFPGQMPGLS